MIKRGKRQPKRKSREFSFERYNTLDFIAFFSYISWQERARLSRACWRDTSNKPFQVNSKSRRNIYEERKRFFTSADGLYVLLCRVHLSPVDRISFLTLASERQGSSAVNHVCKKEREKSCSFYFLLYFLIERAGPCGPALCLSFSTFWVRDDPAIIHRRRSDLYSRKIRRYDYIELLSALLQEDKLNNTLNYFSRCDYIVKRYLIFTLLDSLIVGVINAVAIIVLRLPHIGLISIIVGVTNMIPTFGSVIGGVIGALFLLLSNPLYAVIFLAITLVLQIFDGYIIKPKLFGNSLGISGLLILLAIVTLGKAFGMGGLLLAIPIAAIYDFTYREVLLPYMQTKKTQKKMSEDEI